MIATTFAEANRRFTAPPDLEESQCRTIDAYMGTVDKGSVEGTPMIVTAWQPSRQEIMRIRAGRPIFLTFMGTGLPPHFLTTSFKEATNVA